MSTPNERIVVTIATPLEPELVARIAAVDDALAQLPGRRRGRRAGRAVLIRIYSAGCTHKVLTWMSGQRLSYSVGFPLPHNTAQLLELIPAGVWTPA